MANEEKSRETIERKGKEAYEAGLPIDACPYRTNGPYGKKMRRQWVFGYILARDGRSIRGAAELEITSNDHAMVYILRTTLDKS